MHLRTFIATLAALIPGFVPVAYATCPCPPIPDDIRFGGVGFDVQNVAFWGIVEAIEYRPTGTFAEIDVRRTYTAQPIDGTARIMLDTEPCAPEIRLGVGFLVVSFGQDEDVYRVENCVYSTIEPFERLTFKGKGVQDLDGVREMVEPGLRTAIVNAVVGCHSGDDALASFDLKIDVFRDRSWDLDITMSDESDTACIHASILGELEIPLHDHYPVSVSVSVDAGRAGEIEVVGIPFADDSESRLRRVLETEPDDVAASSRVLRASRQLDDGDTWEAISNVCIADGLVKAEALLDLYEPPRRTLADLFGCAARRDDVHGMLRVLGATTPEEKSLRGVLERLSERDLSIRPIADTGPLTQSRAERLAVLSWAREQTEWVHSAVLLELVAEAVATVDDTWRPSGVVALALHRASLLRPKDEARFRELSATAAPSGELDPRVRHNLTAQFARAEERRRKFELTASEALAAERSATETVETLDPGPDLGAPMEPEPRDVVEEEEDEDTEPLADPALCGLFTLFALFVLGTVVRRGLTSPS